MKRTCNGCRAFESYKLLGGCELGYEKESTRLRTNLGMDMLYQKPKEECPKPKTVSLFVYYLDIKNKQRK